MSSFKEAMLLYFGGYQPDKRLNVDLEEMIIRQNHTPEGAAKLRKIWPKIISEVRKRDTISREVSIESGRELLKQELGRPNPLLDLITKDDSWRGSYLPIPFNTFNTGEKDAK